VTTQMSYAAILLKKMIDPYAPDPEAADYSKLSSTMFELAMAVHSEGQNKAARRTRLRAELTARGLDLLQADIDAADACANLNNLQMESGWKPFDLVDVMAEDLPPVAWLVKPFIPRPSVTAWFGKPKSMKSLLVLDMCLHIAGGVPWLASSPSGKDGLSVTQARIAWLDLENGTAVLKRRMKAIALALGLEHARGQVLAYSMPNPWPDLSKEENTAALIARLQELGDIGVLVIDHLAQALGAIDENSPLIAQVMGNIRQVSEACNVAIVLIHHAKKGQGKDSGAPEDQLRGHGAILANVDAAYLVERDKAERTQIKLMPVAVRGPDAPATAARFSFEQGENLELEKARFWKVVWKSDFGRAQEAILKILADGKKNHTELRAAATEVEAGVSDEKIRQAIASLEGTREITFTKGDKGAKIYELASEGSYE